MTLQTGQKIITMHILPNKRNKYFPLKIRQKHKVKASGQYRSFNIFWTT